MEKIVICGKMEVDVEDGGRAKIGTLYGPDDSQLFVRIQSWVEEEDGVHGVFNDLEGKTLKVTIEVV
jgi:hypothetical protein